MEPALRVGDLVTPASATSPAFKQKHGFGVIIEIDHKDSWDVIVYVVKFTKSQRIYRFSFDGVRRYE